MMLEIAGAGRTWLLSGLTSSYAVHLTEDDELLRLHWGPRIALADAEALAVRPPPDYWPFDPRSTVARRTRPRAAPALSGPRCLPGSRCGVRSITSSGSHSRCARCGVGPFLGEEALDVPWLVVEHLAEQLGVEDASCVKRYTERRQTVYDHAWEIRDAYGYRAYEDREMGRKFRAFLHGRAWTAHAEGPKALFDHAVGWLRRNRVLLPGVSVLARQVAEVRSVADRRLHATVAKAARRADPSLPGDLVATLKTPEGGGIRSWSGCADRRRGPPAPR